jgi:hypothetical protein
LERIAVKQSECRQQNLSEFPTEHAIRTFGHEFS